MPAATQKWVEGTGSPIAAPFLSVEEFGKLIGVKRARAHVLITSGAVASVRLGRRIYVPRRAVEAMIDDSIARARELRDAR
ncbi:MAG: helix-turn-helix domain-containing protein [Chloroflexota bacterium]